MDATTMKIVKKMATTGVPMLLLGPPGTGKTEGVRSLFDYTEVVLLSSETEDSLSGLPYREGAFDLRTIPAMFRRLQEAHNQGKSTCLFLDELDKAPRQVADTLLTLVASRRMGEATLPPDTCIISAANPPEMGGGDGISVPMLNRMSVLHVKPDIEQWVKWATAKYATHSCVVPCIQAVKDAKVPLFESVGDGLDQRVTSPRSLELAMKAIISLGDDKEAIKLVLKGLLTPNTASKLFSVLHFDNPYKETLEKAQKVLDSKANVPTSGAKPKGVKKVTKPLVL